MHLLSTRSRSAALVAAMVFIGSACASIAGLGDFQDAAEGTAGGGQGAAGGGVGGAAGGTSSSGGGGTSGQGGGGGMGGGGGAGPFCGAGHTDNGDGTCTATFYAEAISKSLRRQSAVMQQQTCPPQGMVTDSFSLSEAWLLRKESGQAQFDAFLSFSTALVATSLVEATLLLVEAAEQSPDAVAVYGGVQPIFGATIDTADWDTGTQLLGSTDVAAIGTGEAASFAIELAQVNTAGQTQLRVTLDTSCVYPAENEWSFHSTMAAMDAQPKLVVTYVP